MKTKQKLAAIATGAFILSFFLSVHSNGGSGFQCFALCVDVMLARSGALYFGLGEWLEYSGFVVANLLFLVLAALLMMSARGFYRTRRWLALLIALEVLSWLAIYVQDLSVLRSGYYVWLGAYVLLFFAHFLNHPASNPDVEKGQNLGFS